VGEEILLARGDVVAPLVIERSAQLVPPVDPDPLEPQRSGNADIVAVACRLEGTDLAFPFPAVEQARLADRFAARLLLGLGKLTLALAKSIVQRIDLGM